MEAALLYYGRKKILDNTPIPLSLEKDNDPRLFTSPLKFPGKLAVDVENNRLFISDSNHNRIVGSLSLAPTPSLFLETLLHFMFFFFVFFLAHQLLYVWFGLLFSLFHMSCSQCLYDIQVIHVRSCWKSEIYKLAFSKKKMCHRVYGADEVVTSCAYMFLVINEGYLETYHKKFDTRIYMRLK